MRPRLLDLYCCAGGAAMGYSRAGFDVVGVDIDPQVHYPFEFHQADAIEYATEHGADFDAIHASPPCQHYARVTAWRGSRDDHPDLIDATRDALEATGRPWVIENVMEAPVRADYLLCGSMFGLAIRRHRIFETSWQHYELRDRCQHSSADLPFMHKGERAFADAMGCTWMSSVEAREAIPPAYTAHIGAQLLELLSHFDSSSRITDDTSTPFAAAFSDTADHNSSGMRTVRRGVWVSDDTSGDHKARVEVRDGMRDVLVDDQVDPAGDRHGVVAAGAGHVDRDSADDGGLGEGVCHDMNGTACHDTSQAGCG